MAAVSKESLRKAFVGWQLAITDLLLQTEDVGNCRRFLRTRAEQFTVGLDVPKQALDAVEDWFNWEEIERQLG